MKAQPQISLNRTNVQPASLSAALTWAAAGLFSYALTTFMMVYYLQHLLPPNAVLPVWLGLAAALSPLMRVLALHLQARLALLPSPAALIFVAVMLMCGLLFFFLKPIQVPQFFALRDIPGLLMFERATRYLASILVFAVGLSWLILQTVGDEAPIVPRLAGFSGFFVGVLILGFLIHDDFGLAIDEAIQWVHSNVSAKYALSVFSPELASRYFSPSVEPLRGYFFSHYPVGFQLPLAFAETFNSMASDIYDFWMHRHMMIFLFYMGGVAAFFRLAFEKFKDWRLALAGAAMLVCSPLMFPHVFGNIKDGVFLAAFAISLYFGFRFWRAPTLGNMALLAASTALAANVRVVAAFLIVGVIGAAVIYHGLPSPGRRPGHARQMWISLAVLPPLYAALHTLLLPASWYNPIAFNLYQLDTFSDFDRWRDTIYYMGQLVYGEKAPWHYLPVWMLITIPVSYTLLFITGALNIGRAALTRHIRLLNDDQLEDVGFLALFSLPIVALIVMNSTVYSDWRQFYFLYIPFLLVALNGLAALVAAYNQAAGLPKRGLLALFGLMGVYQLYIVGWMIYNHPQQHMFRATPMVELFGGREGFDGDMMRFSDRQALEFIAAYDPDRPLYVALLNGSVLTSIQVLPDDEQRRISTDFPIRWGETDYVIVGSRRPDLERMPLGIRLIKVHEITVDGFRVITVYRVIFSE